MKWFVLGFNGLAGWSLVEALFRDPIAGSLGIYGGFAVGFTLAAYAYKRIVDGKAQCGSNAREDN